MRENSSDTMPPGNDDVSNATSSNPHRNNDESHHTLESSKGATNHTDFLAPPWLFKHNDLNSTLEITKRIDDTFLRNKLNYIHFMDRELLVLLRHPKYDELLTVNAKPCPCTDGEVTCQLLVDRSSLTYLTKYTFLHLIINDGQSLILIPITMARIKEDRIFFQLPQKGYSVGQRQVKRYPCEKIDVELVQRGLMIKGELLDYSPKGFCVRIRHVPSGGFDWSTGSDALTMVHLRRDQTNFFSGLCQCLRQQDGTLFTDVVLAPAKNQGNYPERERFKKGTKNVSLKPVIIFDHPFIGKRIQLDVSDISTSGFSVCEKANERVLIEGMIIPDLAIEFAGSVRIKCSAQIIGRNEEDEGIVRSDFVILDMGINSYSQLSHILVNTADSHAYISKEVDMDALWEFFFEAGFIYPNKYRVLQQKRDRFKETWSKLYQQDLEVAKHVTYQKNGRIYGHISMLRAYARTWMIHHHACRKSKSGLAGFIVLKQMMDYLNDMHRLPSANMDFVMSYFRPENKFPNSVFGGFGRTFGNSRACSLDLFTYLPYISPNCKAIVPDGWTLTLSSSFDLWELNRFYSNYSGGLLMDAMGIGQADPYEGSLEKVYGRLGFLRKWTAYSLKHEAELNAILIVDQSDVGVNLSELLNSIKIVVINFDDLGWDILSTAISQLAHHFDTEKVPVLCYPFEYVDSRAIPFEKQYYAWVLNVCYGNDFMEYMYKKYRLNHN